MQKVFGIPLSPFLWVAGVVVAAPVGYGCWWTYHEITELQGGVAALQTSLTSTADLLRFSLNQTQATITAQNQNLRGELGTLSGTVSTLQKLSETDPQLLAKYSKIYFLNEHYIPERLVQIGQDFVYSDTRPEQILAQVWPHLQALLNDANDDDISLYVESAYRSFDEQQALKGQYSVVYGSGTANQFSADQGYSEHQLGTTIDLITTGTGGALAGFDQKPAYQWLLKNAYKYGFILSYPKGNGYYIFEPWHWRFVGVALATHLHNEGKNFYDLDQREIDTYLASLFD